jgi:hypothetical protein
MAKSAASTAPNPFASAARKPTAAAKKSDSPIIVADDTKTYDGGIFSKSQVADAIVGYAEGHEQFEQGKAMKDTNRPVLIAVARTRQAESWMMLGARPKNPKMVTDPKGTGPVVGVQFNDSVNNLDENSYATLANLIGVNNAEQLTIKRDDFVINPELLGETAKVKRDGKIIDQNVMTAIAEALQERFAPSPEILAALFQVVPKFTTTKGLIDKGLSLVTSGKTPADALRLATFLEVGRFTTQLKVGASGSD